MQKKGVSAVVATVLIIMITVAAIGIIWGAVMPLVRNSLDSSISEDVELSIETSEGYTVYDPDTKILQVQISRGQDDANISKLEVRVEIDGRTLDPVICSPPEKNEMNLCSINLASYPGKITGISVIPIILKGKQELQGSVKQTAELPPNTPIPRGSFEIRGYVSGPGDRLSYDIYDSLIGYWNFDRDDITKRVDGKVGNGVDFGSINAEIKTETSLSNNVYSGSFWFYTPTVIDSLTGGTCPIGVGSGTSEGVCFGSTTSSYSGEVINIVGGTGGQYTVWNESGANIGQGWHHLAYSLNGNAYDIYLDNVLLTTQSQANSFQDSSQVIVGRRPYSDFWWSGYVDELNLFDRSLDAGDVSSLYQDGMNGQHGQITSGLVLQWNFEELGGIISDSSSNSNDGKYLNFSFGPAHDETFNDHDGFYSGKAYSSEGALSLDGGGDYVNVSSNVAIGGNKSRTYSMWFNPDFKQGRQDFFKCGQGNIQGIDCRLIYDISTADEGIYFSGYSADCGGNTNTIGRQSWNYIAAVYNGTDMFLYVNGNLDNVCSINLNTSISDLLIGDAGAGDFIGSIDELMIFDRDLTASEIQEIYNAGR